MRTSHFVYIGISLLLLASCKEETEKPKVTYDASKVGRELTKADSTQIKIADKQHIPYTLVFGEEEAKSETVKLKNLKTSEVSIMPQKQIADYITAGA